MKNLLFSGAAALCLLLSACSKERIDEMPRPENDPQPGVKTERLYLDDEGSTDQQAPDSRAAFDANRHIVWQEGDQVVVNGKKYPLEYDAASGSWYVSVESAASYTAFYPATRWVDPSSDPDRFGVNGSLWLTGTQSYVEGSFDTTAYCAYAKADRGGKLLFKSMSGLFRLTLKGDAQITGIDLYAFDSSSNTVVTCGCGKLLEAGDGSFYVGRENMYAASTKIDYQCATPVQLTDRETDFYIGMLPQEDPTVKFGMAIKGTYPRGETFSIVKYTKPQTLLAGQILKMPVLTIVDTAPVLYSTDNATWKGWNYGSDGTTPVTLAYPETTDHMLYFKDNESSAGSKGLTLAHLQSLSTSFVKNHYLTGESADAVAEKPIGLDFSQATYESTTLPSDIFTYSNEEKFNNSLIYLSLPKNIAKIESRAFSRTQVLRTIILPQSVTELANEAFWVVRGVNDIYCYAAVPPTLSGTVFGYIGWGNSSMLRVHVPAANFEAYQSTWGADYWLRSRATLVGDL